MKTVLQLIDTTGPGGAETIFTDLIRELPKAKYRVVPVITGEGWVQDQLREDGSEPIVLPTEGRSRLGYLRDLVGLIRRERASLVHTHLLGSALYGTLAARLAGARAICTFHGPADFPAEDRFRGIRFRLIGSGAARVVCVSESLRRAILAATPLPPSRVTVIHNGVDRSAVSAGAGAATLRRELGIPPETLLLGALGNIRAPKGYDQLLHALARLDPATPPWHLVIAGDTAGEVFPPLEQLRETLGLRDRVTFAGFRRDIGNVLHSLDLFVLSSLTEGFSLATVQALAAGVPVIATRSGGPEEILADSRGGLLVPAGDPGALASALADLMGDPELRRQLARQGPEVVEARFSLEAMLEAYQRLYDGI